MKRRLPRLYLVTDQSIVVRADFVERAAAGLAAGGEACALQLRAHGLGGRALLEIAVRLMALRRATGASLWINDRIDVALAVRADGIQLGEGSIETEAARRLLGLDVAIGRSIHAAQPALSTADRGADMFVLGSLFPTESHRGRRPLGLGELRAATAGSRPIVAIGGITPERVREVMKAGAWGVAARGGVWDSQDTPAEVRRYLRALQQSIPEDGAG